MACKTFRRDLARYRELGLAERQALEAHLLTCSQCRRALAAYAQQDALLGALGTIQPSENLAQRVAMRIRALSDRRTFPLRRLAPALASLVVILLFGSTLAVSASALPGTPLYPLKRGQEELRLRLLPAGTPRAEYAQTLAERRRQEAQRLLQTGGTAEVTFEGTVEAIRGAHWRVGGVKVQVDGQVQPDPSPALGERVSIRARIQGGHAIALGVERISPSPTLIKETPQPTVERETPTATPRLTEAPISPTQHPEGTPTNALAPSAAPSHRSPGQLKKTPQIPTPTPTERPHIPTEENKGSPGNQAPGRAPNGAPHGRP